MSMASDVAENDMMFVVGQTDQIDIKKVANILSLDPNITRS